MIKEIIWVDNTDMASLDVDFLFTNIPLGGATDFA